MVTFYSRLFDLSNFRFDAGYGYRPLIPLIVLTGLAEFATRKYDCPLTYPHLPVVVRWGIYITLMYFIMVFNGSGPRFIYFQF